MSDAGWYPDPSDPQQLRYWDGSSWTDDVRARPATSVLPTVLPFGVDASAPAPPPAPSTFGPPTATWETTYTPPPTPRSAAPTYAVRRKSSRRRPIWLIALFVLLALAVLGGAAFGVWKFADSVGSASEFDRPGVVVSSGDGSVPEADLVAALGRFGIVCKPDPTGVQPHAELVATIKRIKSDMDAQSSDLGEAAADFVDAVTSLDATASYSITSCDSTLIVVSDGAAMYGYFDAMAPPAVAAASDLGLRLVSLAPPRMTDTVDLIERRDESCPLPGRTTTKEVLLAELLPRLAPADGSAPTSAALIERKAIDLLPDQQIVVRNCTHTRVLGVGSWAQLVILSADSTVAARALGQVKVIGP